MAHIWMCRYIPKLNPENIVFSQLGQQLRIIHEVIVKLNVVVPESVHVNGTIPFIHHAILM